MMKDEHLTLDELMELVRQMQEQRRASDPKADGVNTLPNEADEAPYLRPTPYATNNNNVDTMEETDDDQIR